MVDHQINTAVSATSSPESTGLNEPESTDLAGRSQADCPPSKAVIEPKPWLATGVTLDLRAEHQNLLRILTALILVAVVAEWIFLTTQRPEPLPIQRGPYFENQFRVEVNSATWVEWLQLEGIGPSLAHRIVADRKLNGPFASINDITRVPGIGPTTLDRIRRWLTIRHDLSDANPTETSHAGPSARQPANDQRQSPAF